MTLRTSLRLLARTKTVATVGPAISSVEKLVQLTLDGVDVFRINTAHGDTATHSEFLNKIRQASRQAGQPVAALADLAGPKIRLGTLLEDPYRCDCEQPVAFIRGDVASTPNELTTNYVPLLDELDVGDTVMLSDGTVRLEVSERTSDRAVCRVIDGGIIRSRQGVNLPGVKLSVPAMSDTDRENAIWAAKHGVDFVSLSFVRTAKEIRELKQLLLENGSKAQVIAKIEKREAMENLESIVEATDGVMVARGDLGVEIDIAQTALAQKRIIHICREHGKPVIVATQMLDSMHHSLRPTRAEVADISNAILDGADACMLSGETAIGDYPAEAVRMMQRIMVETERVLHRRPSRTDVVRDRTDDYSGAVVFGASQVAKQLDAQLVVLATGASEVLLAKSKQRDYIPTVCVTESEYRQRRACLFWGIYPLLAEKADDAESVCSVVRQWLRNDPNLTESDLMVVVANQKMLNKGLDTIYVHPVLTSSAH